MPASKDRLALDFISGLGMPPTDFIHLAADLGLRQIGFAVTPMVLHKKAYTTWSLKDQTLQRDVKSALQHHGISIAVGEGFFIRPGADISDYAPDMEILHALGAQRVNALSFDPDLSRSTDQFARFADMATERGLKPVIEFVHGMLIGDLKTAQDLLTTIGNPELGLVIDMMHLIRSGSTAADLAALNPNLIAYAQLCDVPLACTYTNYGYEAAYERLPPGEGELPLRDLLAALPKTTTIGLEIPMLAKAESGIGPHARLAPCVETAVAMLELTGG